MRRVLTALIAIILSMSAQAALKLELTQGVNKALPIAVASFPLAKIIRADLKNSGEFRLIGADNPNHQPKTITQINHLFWRKQGADTVVVGKVTPINDEIQLVNVAVVDTISQDHVLWHKKFRVKEADFRRLAHHISDMIFQKLTGKRGIFSTKIAFVTVKQLANKSKRYQLMVSDIDGFNPQPLLTSSNPIMSPSWSPDGKQVAYVSFERKRAQIYVVNITSGQRRLITSFPGINGAPAWSPDGNTLALVLSKSGVPKIYLANLVTRKLTPVTDGWSIDTEPSWSPDGKSLIFTSNRGGTPQIYRVNLATHAVERVTYDGEYNATASYTPDGKHIVMLHRDQSGFNIAIQDIGSGQVRRLTLAGNALSPSVAPNGRMVLYEIQGGRLGSLGLVSTDGKVKVRLPTQEGELQEPSWSPFIS